MALELKAHITSPFAVQLVGEGFNPKAYELNSTPTMEFIMADDELDDKDINWYEMLTLTKIHPNSVVKYISKKLDIDPKEILVHPVECRMVLNNIEQEDGQFDAIQICGDVHHIASSAEDSKGVGSYDEKYAIQFLNKFYSFSYSYRVIIEICDKRNSFDYDYVKTALSKSPYHHPCVLSNL